VWDFMDRVIAILAISAGIRLTPLKNNSQSPREVFFYYIYLIVI